MVERGYERKNFSPSLHVQLCLLVDSLGYFQIALHNLTITQFSY